MNGFLLGLWIGCQALDGGTTAANLAQPNRVEANPLMAGHGYTLRISANVWAMWATRKGRPVQRNITAASFAVSGCLMGGWNTYQLKRTR